MKEIFQNGGIVTYLLLIVSIFSFAVVLEKFVYYFRYEKNKKTNSISKLIKTLNEKSNKNARISLEHLEESAREFILESSLVFEKRIWLLALIGHMAPLLGLFGTITGMIKAFSVIAMAGTGDPKLLADGISEALITTAGGILVALPAMIFYSYFNRKNEELISLMEKATVEFINDIRDKNYES